MASRPASSGANGAEKAPATNSTNTTREAEPSQSSSAQQSLTQNGAPAQDRPASSKKPSKKERPQTQEPAAGTNAATAGTPTKLTGAQLKEQKKAEKLARRAAEKGVTKGEQAQAEQAQPQSTNRPDPKQRRPSQGAAPAKKDGEQLQTPAQHHKRKPSNQPVEAGVVRLPLRPGQQSLPTPQVQQKVVDKRVPMVAHLYPSARPASLTTASREIHPSVLTLGLHLRSLTLAGSTARTLALLLTLKRVIRAYTTPPSTALSRHLTTHLSHQISFLSSARPLGIAQGNAIRWLKKLISQLDPDLDDNDAKKFLCEAVDSFIIEKVTYASEVIANQACTRIDAADETILVYGKSSVVEKTLLRAAREAGKKFKVIVVDSRPFFEGRNLAKGLLRAGMRQGGELPDCEVIYTLLSGLSDVFLQHSVTKCFLGASAMLGNGSLYSRCGTALVAMMAKQHQVPVIVLAESLKFTGKMVVDSLSLNEVGDPDALIEIEEDRTITDTTTTTTLPSKQDDSAGKKGGGGSKKKGGSGDDDASNSNAKDADDDNPAKNSILGSWRDQKGLYLLNLMYDVTPKEFLDMVVCELGTLPPSAVPVVNGVHGEDE